MTVFSLHSERYGVTGNIGENFLRLLGAPTLGQLQTVIRESVQNIADAAKLGVGPDILIRLRYLQPGELACFREQLLAELPDEGTSRIPLQAFLEADAPAVLEICDYGTTGLGGPTRADRIPVGTKRTDFINFLRNIGTPRDTELGGGTYGFGKAALYAVSRCRTILVDTETDEGDGRVRRLMGCHIGSRFEIEDEGMLQQHTGRHWWGVAENAGGIVDPAVGADAAALARAVGLPSRDVGCSGTSIMILDFETEGEELLTIGQRIVEGLLWSFWPRMMRDAPQSKRFNCRVMVGETDLEIPAPEDFAPLDLFCKAMRAARETRGNDVRRIASKNPAKHLGYLAMEKGIRGDRRSIVPNESLFPTSSHHIALMRPVELVVRYFPGLALPDERFEWAGVFLVDREEEVERAFAQSEPPAHDDWVPGNMDKGHAKTFVRVALRDIEVAARSMGELGSAKLVGTSDAPPLARVAGKLGSALIGVGGDGAGLHRDAAGRNGVASGPKRRARVTRPVFRRLVREAGHTLAMFVTELSPDPSSAAQTLVARASAAMDGAAVKLDPSLEHPSVIRIRASDDSLSTQAPTLNVAGVSGLFEIFVRVPADCAVTVDVEVVEGEAG